MDALRKVMLNGIFQVGDCYFAQIDGMMMGTPPVPPYATLYFSRHENKCCDAFAEVQHYFRFLDDVIGIWVPTHDANTLATGTSRR